jgi:class 3 adenylate cyclase/tetratricopeptide (TPR) repeat protein
MSARTETGYDSLLPYVPGLLAGWDGDLPGMRAVEGTLVYADVSGFTRLSERLSRQGRAGAEEIVNAVSDVWSNLLTAAGDGDPLKFAGDALITFFDGPDHAGRACAAGLAMQEALERSPSIRVGRSAVRLRMSVGVHTGTFLMTAVGSTHLDLLVLGPDASHTVAMESAAAAGEVLASDATRARLEGRLVADRRPDGWAVTSVEGTATDHVKSRRQVGDPRLFVPPLLRDLLDAGPLYEHRRATIAFCQLGGIDATLASDGPDRVFERVGGFTAELMDLLDTHGVLLTSCDLGSDGSVYMMSAGVPRTDGDHELRMIHVAREALARADGLAIRWGINSGHVFAGAVGSPARRAYVAMGDTTNLAARVMTQAGWGEVLATAGSIQPIRERLQARAVPPFSVKGKKQAIEAMTIEGISRARGNEADHDDLLVGRGEELALLEEAAAAALAGKGRVVETSGEQGVGKSRLVAEVIRAWSETHLSVVGDPFERTTPYHTARAVLRPLFSVDADATPAQAGAQIRRLVEASAPQLLPWLPLLGMILDAEFEPTPAADQIDPRYRRIKAQQVVADLVVSLPSDPTLLTIEDAEHIDDASAELIAEMLGRVGERPWLVLITRSPGDEGLTRGRGYDATEVRLVPLDREQAMELALRLAESHPVPSHMVAEIAERSAGNPLFLIEMLAYSGGELPHSVEDIVAIRVDALSPPDRRALRLLAVLGETFEEGLAEVILREEGVDTGDENLWTRLGGLVERSKGRVRFANPLVRQVAYDGLPYQIRRRVHGRVADALGARRPDQLPLHLVRAERWAEAWQAARVAGDRAMNAAANAVAGELYEMALTAAHNLEIDPAEISEVAARCGEMWSRAGRPERALQYMNLAIGSSSDPIRRAILGANRASIYENSGRYSQALRLLTLAMNRLDDELATGNAHQARATLHAGYASTLLRQGRHQEAIPHAELAVAAAEKSDDRRLQAQALHLLDRIHTARGDLSEAQTYRDAALPLFAAVGDLAAQGTALHDLAAEAHRHERWAEAAWLYQRASDARAQAGDVIRAAATTNSLGEVELAMGMEESAEARFAEALRVWRGARSPEGVVAATTNLGGVRLRQGRIPEAIGLLEEAEVLALDLGSEHALTQARLALSEAYLADKRYVEAWERATAAIEAGPDPEIERRARAVRASALGATGSQERADHERRLAVDNAGSPVAQEP